MTRAELIAALVAATGPSRELDAQVHEADAVSPNWKKWLFADGSISVLIPPYTGSIDVALMLVPEGNYWIVACGKTRSDEPLYGARVLPPTFDPDAVPLGEGESDASAATALCIAALRAGEA